MELVEDIRPATLPALPQKAALEKVADSVNAVANSITINSPAMYEIAVEELTELQRKVDDLTEQRFKITRPMDASKKEVMDLFRGPIERCEAGIAFLKKLMLDYVTAEKKRAAESQRIADEQARQERLRLEKEARDQQAAADQKVREAQAAAEKAAAATKVAEEATAAGDTEAANKASAEALAATQMQAAAQADAEVAHARVTLNQTIASVMTAPVVASAAPKIAGVSTSERWTAEVTDLLTLVKYVAANPQYITFLQANMTPIKQMATSLKANMKIDGVRAFPQAGITARRK
ncbi:hypothetical protein [Collimonas humicola]|uniref:hypothetical protein n=1 Tax=Collimonas humicola TaxID=2825886 RepID=UPI001B8C8C2E|nr:hypothetical protein [Collimonas humicola]